MAKTLRALLPRRVRRLCVLAATTALLAVACLPASSYGSVEWVVQQVQLLHRHGSRSALPDYNASAICGATPCGLLNPEGELMARNVGSFLRERYTTDATVVDQPFLTSDEYDLAVVSSRSTDVLRTLQSGALFLAGMFPNASRLIPAIHTVATSTDTMLYTVMQPWLLINAFYDQTLIKARMNPVVDSYFPDWTELTALGAELASEGYCSSYENRYNCASTLWDIAAAKNSIGELPAAVAARYNDLGAIVAENYRYIWYYNASDPLMVKQGGRGQEFLQQVLKNVDDFFAGTNTFKVMHYSAHDVSVAPIWGTLGDDSVDGVRPPYSQTFVLELLKRESDGAYAVRVLRGWPGQTPDTGYAFSWDNTWQLRCLSANGTVYDAAGNLCLLDDFRRYVASTVGTSPLGMCYLDDATKAALKCPTTAEDLAATGTVSTYCRLYRTTCAAHACETGYVLDAVTLRCSCNSASCRSSTTTTDNGNGNASNTSSTPVAVTVSMPGVSSGAAAGIAIATFAVGALLAMALTLVIASLCRRRNSSEERRPDYVQKYSADGRPVRE